MSAAISAAPSATYSHVTVNKALTIDNVIQTPGSHYVFLNTETVAATLGARFTLPGDAIIKSVTLIGSNDSVTGAFIGGTFSFKDAATNTTDYTGLMSYVRATPGSAKGNTAYKITPPAPIRIPSGVRLRLTETVAGDPANQDISLCVEYALLDQNDSRNVASV